MIRGILAIVALLLAFWAEASPVVTNVRSKQIPGTHKVEILYDLVSDRECIVATEVSTDRGVTYGVIVPPEAFTGAIGSGVLSGSGRSVVFDTANSQLKLLFSKQIRFKVKARSIEINEGLVAYYPFDGSGNDASGNGYHGTLQGGVKYALGRTGMAAQFDGVNDFVSVASNPGLNLTNKFTVSAWIFQQSAQSNGYRIVDKCSAGIADGWTFDTYGNGNGGCRLRMQAADLTGRSVVGTTDYTLLAWHHVVATVSGTTGAVYFDGLLNGDGLVGQIPSNSLDLFIGGPHPYNAGVVEFFNGLIDDVRIYKRTLSAAEVEDLFNAG